VPNSPAPRQQDNAAFGFGQVDDLQLKAKEHGLPSRRLASVALVDQGAGQAMTQEQAITDRYKMPGGLYHRCGTQGDGYRMHQRPDCGKAF